MKATLARLKWYTCLCLIVLSACSYVKNQQSYEPEMTNEAIMKQSVYKFMEIFSLSNSRALSLLNNIASESVVTKFTSLSGDTETRVPVPKIWSYTQISDRKVEILFDSQTRDYVTLYRYVFEFDLNNLIIQSVKTEYYYRGVNYEDEMD